MSMFTADEADGYNQIGQNMTPTDQNSASSWAESFTKLGDKALHAAFGQTTFPEMKDALQVMYGSNNPGAVDLQSGNAVLSGQGFPNIEVVNSTIPSPPVEFTSTETLQPADGKLFADITAGLNNFMTEMCKTFLTGPFGILGGLLQLLLGFLTQVLTGAGEMLTSAAQAALSFNNQLWKKQLLQSSG